MVKILGIFSQQKYKNLYIIVSISIEAWFFYESSAGLKVSSYFEKKVRFKILFINAFFLYYMAQKQIIL